MNFVGATTLGITTISIMIELRQSSEHFNYNAEHSVCRSAECRGTDLETI
jgi:hypothetical protein